MRSPALGDDDDFFLGTSADENVHGRGGNDTLTGGGGHDTLYGDAGNDVLASGHETGVVEFYGGAGDDEIRSDYDDFGDFADGGGGFDRFVLDLRTISAGGAILDFSNSFVVEVAGFDWVTVQHFEALSLIGTFRGDSILGSGGADVIDGNGGADTINGRGGDDRIIGYPGAAQSDGTASMLDGGKGNDTLILNMAGASGDIEFQVGPQVTVSQTPDFTVIARSFEAVELTTGAGNDVVSGGAVSDVLSTGSGNDTLAGGAGADLLNGGGGRDVLTGGADADTFRFNALADSAAGSARDLVTDFAAGEDTIDLKQIIDGLPFAVRTNFHFIGKAEFSGAAGELRYDFEHGHTIISMNVDAGTVADFEIDLTGKIHLTATDFIF